MKDRHHLFNYYEVKYQLEALYTEIGVSFDEEKLSTDAYKLWKRGAKVTINVDAHAEYHKNNGSKVRKRPIRIKKSARRGSAKEARSIQHKKKNQ